MEKSAEISFPGKGDSKCKGPEAKTRFQCSGLSREPSAADCRDKGKQKAIRTERQAKDRLGRIVQMGKI